MNNFKVLVYDSGIGGITVLDYLAEQFHSVDFYYMSDSKNFPYGMKSREMLFRIAKDNLNRAGVENFDAVILACNTLTSSCIKDLENCFPNTYFIGVNPLSSLLGNKNLIFCTTRTAKNILDNVSTRGSVITLDNLIKDIENNIFDLGKIKLENYITISPRYFNRVILGCTHFNFLKGEFFRLFSSCDLCDGFLPVFFDLKFYLTTFDHFKPQTEFCDDFAVSYKNVKFIFADKMRNFEVYKSLKSQK